MVGPKIMLTNERLENICSGSCIILDCIIWYQASTNTTVGEVYRRRLEFRRTALSGVGLRRYTCRLNVWLKHYSQHKTKLRNASMKSVWLDFEAGCNYPMKDNLYRSVHRTPEIIVVSG